MDASIKVSIIDITPSQVRAARALLGWTLDRLETASGLPKRTLTRFENDATAPRAATIAAIRGALEAAGVEFIAENGGGAGVRLRSRIKVEVAGKLVGYAPAFRKGKFTAPENPAQKQTRVKVEGREFGLRWAYQEPVAILFESEADARTWGGFEPLP